MTQRERWLAVSSETPQRREKTADSVKGQSNNWATESQFFFCFFFKHFGDGETENAIFIYHKCEANICRIRRL